MKYSYCKLAQNDLSSKSILEMFSYVQSKNTTISTYLVTKSFVQTHTCLLVQTFLSVHVTLFINTLNLKNDNSDLTGRLPISLAGRSFLAGFWLNLYFLWPILDFFWPILRNSVLLMYLSLVSWLLPEFSANIRFHIHVFRCLSLIANLVDRNE